MDFETIKRNHRNDMIIQWIYYGVGFALITLIISCAVHMKKVSGRSPASLKVEESEILRLQEENAELRAALTAAERQLASLKPKKKRAAQPSVKKTPPAPSKAPPRAHKVAEVKKEKKRPKVIQVSFDDPKL